MNILILSWRGPGDPLAGGAEKVTLTHAKYWAELGHSVYWFTSVYPSGIFEERIEGVNIIRRGSSVYYGVIFWAFWWYLFKKHTEFDVVIDQFHGLPFFAPLYIKKPIIGFIHELGSQVVRFNPWPKPFNLLPIMLAPLCEPLMFKLFYRDVPFITVSQSTKTDLEKFGIKEVTIVPNGIETPKNLRSFSKEKRLTITYLSHLAKDKGIEDAIETFKLIKNEIPESQFWIIGKGEQNYVEHLKHLAPEAKFFGYVSELKKYELLAKSHVLIFPSIHEGWGLVIIEAASVGTPTIAYRVSGVKDAVLDKQTGFLSDQLLPTNLANLVIHFFNNPDLYGKMRIECVKWSKKFEWDKSTRLSLKLIEEVTFTNRR